jgi:methyl-accepting chemotaxis protein
MATIIDNIELDESNQEFFWASELEKYNHKLIYLTGKAGTGKTTFLKYLRETSKKNIVILAPTGVAAMNAGGQTIHSFFQIKPSVYVPNDKRLRTISDFNDTDKSTIYDHFKYFKEKLEIIRGLDLLIIDEISMVRCDLLDVIDRLLRVFRHRKKEPFGGVQVILIGDTFQLPPIADFEQWEILKSYYKSPFFFSSNVIESNKPTYIELKKIYRQNEQEFIDVLNRVRVNQVTSNELNLLNSRYNPTFSPDKNSNYITLATHNTLVGSTNITKLGELSTELKLFEATVTGLFPDNIIPTDRVLKLKEGAQVMFIKNDKSRRYYNGRIGKIKKIDNNGIVVEFSEENKITIEKQEWNNIKYTWNEKEKKIEEEVIGTFIQYPIKLAWAITVHKSQGLTFEKVIADLGAAFASGQVYVALSRCTTFNGLVLKTRIGQNAIMTSPQVLEFAKYETPDTLILTELNSGKADFYYKKVREGIKNRDFNEVYENFIKAIKFRNDIETPSFKRFFLVFTEKLSSNKDKFLKIDKLISQFEKENLKLNTTLKKAKDLNIKLKENIEQVNNSLKQVTNERDEIADRNISLAEDLKYVRTNYNTTLSTIQKIQRHNAELKKSIEKKDNLLIAIEKQNKQNKIEIIAKNKLIENMNAEIEGLKKVKWYKVLFR